jgi:hypothetical protein
MRFRHFVVAKRKGPIVLNRDAKPNAELPGVKGKTALARRSRGKRLYMAGRRS